MPRLEGRRAELRFELRTRAGEFLHVRRRREAAQRRSGASEVRQKGARSGLLPVRQVRGGRSERRRLRGVHASPRPRPRAEAVPGHENTTLAISVRPPRIAAAAGAAFHRGSPLDSCRAQMKKKKMKACRRLYPNPIQRLAYERLLNTNVLSLFS